MSRLTRDWLFAILASLILIASLPGRAMAQKPAEEAKSPETQVRAALADAVKRLDNGDTRGFLEYYYPAEQLRLMRQANAVEEVADELKQHPERFGDIRGKLAKAMQVKPTFDRSGAVADFEITLLADEQDAPKPIPFQEPSLTKAKLPGLGSDLPTVLSKAEELLNNNEISNFVTHLFPAGELRHPDAKARGAALAQRLKDQPRLIEQMKSDLQVIQKLTPTYSTAKDVAEYRLPGTKLPLTRTQTVTTPERVFKFQLVEGSWRFPDNTTPARRTVAQNLARTLPSLTQFPGVQEKVTLERLGDHWRLAP